MAGRRLRHAAIITILSVIYHRCLCESDKCPKPPSVFVNKSVSADSILLLNLPNTKAEDCVQYCCSSATCSAVVFLQSENMCYLMQCPLQGQCVGDDLSGATLYLIDNSRQDDLLHNHIRQLDQSNTTATTSTTSAPTTGAITTTTTETPITTMVTTAAPPDTTLTPQTEPTTQAVQITSIPADTGATQLTTQKPPNSTLAPNLTITPNSSKPPDSNPDVGSKTSLPSPTTPATAGANVTEQAPTTTTASNQSNITQVTGGVTVVTDATTPTSNVLTTLPPGNSTPTPNNTGIVFENKTVYAEKRHWSRDWRRKHFHEHGPVKDTEDDSVDLSPVLTNIFGGGVDGGEGIIGDGYELPGIDSRQWGVQRKPSFVHHKPGLMASLSGKTDSGQGDAEKFGKTFRVPHRPPHKLPYLTPHRLLPYPIPHKIGAGIESHLKGATAKQPVTESAANVTVNPSSSTVNESAVTTTTLSSTTESPGPSATTTATPTGTTTEAPDTTASSNAPKIETTATTTTTIAPNTTATETQVPTTSEAGAAVLETTGPTGGGELTTSAKLETTPLISANDSLADLAIEANDRAMSAALIAALSFGVLFFAAVMVLLTKRLYDGWQKRHYSRVDYLVNGMYN